MAPGSSTKPGFRQDPVQLRSRTDPVQSRSREDPAGSGQAGVTNSVFAGAMVASVLLTFVVGFSAGVLSQPQVLRWVRTSLLKRTRYTAQVENNDNNGDVAV